MWDKHCEISCVGQQISECFRKELNKLMSKRKKDISEDVIPGLDYPQIA